MEPRIWEAAACGVILLGVILHCHRTGSRLATMNFLRKPLTSVATLALVPPMLVAAAVVGNTVATPHADAQTPTRAWAPPSRDAYIYDAFDAWGNPDTQGTYGSLESLLKNEGYKVKEYEDTANGPGTAKISRLANLGDAGVLILSSHAGVSGQELEVYGQCRYVVAHSYGNVCDPASSEGVEDPQWKIANKAAQKYDKLYGADFVQLTYGSYPVYSGGNLLPSVYRWVLNVTEPGLERIFTQHTLGIVVNAGCNSQVLSQDFNAQSYFGYSSNVCSTTSNSDLDTLFQNNLSGASGLSQRNTLEATGFSSAFKDVPSAMANSPLPVTLSPAVASVSPVQGSTITSLGGGGIVGFDTGMDTRIDPNGSHTVSVKGCGASIDPGSEQWGSTDLDFNYTIPENETGTITFTVHAHFAKAQSPGEDSSTFLRLDGNQSPSPQNGVDPNGTDYVWQASCNTVQSPPPTATCDDVSGAPYNGIGATDYGYDTSVQPFIGSGFAPNENVVVTENDGGQIGQGVTDGDGNLSTTVTIPGQPDDTYTLTATGDSGDSAECSLGSGGTIWAVNSGTCDPNTDVWTVNTDWEADGVDANGTYSFSISTGDVFTAQTDSTGHFDDSFTEMIDGGTSPTWTLTGPYGGAVVTWGQPSQSYGGFPDCSNSNGIRSGGHSAIKKTLRLDGGLIEALPTHGSVANTSVGEKHLRTEHAARSSQRRTR